MLFIVVIILYALPNTVLVTCLNPGPWFAVWDVRLALCGGFGPVCVDHERESTEENRTRG